MQDAARDRPLRALAVVGLLGLGLVLVTNAADDGDADEATVGAGPRLSDSGTSTTSSSRPPRPGTSVVLPTTATSAPGDGVDDASGAAPGRGSGPASSPSPGGSAAPPPPPSSSSSTTTTEAPDLTLAVSPAAHVPFGPLTVFPAAPCPAGATSFGAEIDHGDPDMNSTDFAFSGPLSADGWWAVDPFPNFVAFAPTPGLIDPFSTPAVTVKAFCLDGTDEVAAYEPLVHDLAPLDPTPSFTADVVGAEISAEGTRCPFRVHVWADADGDDAANTRVVEPAESGSWSVTYEDGRVLPPGVEVRAQCWWYQLGEPHRLVYEYPPVETAAA